MAKDKILTIADEILKEYGEIMSPADSLIESQGRIISVLPSFDIALSGGLVEGTITVLSSQPRSGKSTTALTIIAAAQHQYKKKCYYVDVEGRLTPQLMSTIPGLIWTEKQEKETGIPRMQVIKSSKGNFLTAEKYLNIIDKLFRSEEGCVVVLDSIAALCTESLFAANIGDSARMAAIPALMYAFMRKIAQVLPAMKSNLIAITHLQAKLDPYKAQTGMGGNAQEFFGSNVLISFSSKEEEDKDGYKIGRNTTFRVTKSALGKPGGEVVIYIRYGKGCDRNADIVELGEQLGFIAKTGAWYMYNDQKVQGKENLVSYFKENPKEAVKLEKQIREIALGDTNNESGGTDR